MMMCAFKLLRPKTDGKQPPATTVAEPNPTASAMPELVDGVPSPAFVQEGFVDIASAENPTHALLLLAQTMQSSALAGWHDEIDVNTGYLYLTPAQVRRVVKLIEEAGKPLGVLFTQVPETQQAALSQGFLIKETPVLRPRRVVIAPAIETPISADATTPPNNVDSLANALFASIETQASDVDASSILPAGIVEQQSQPSNIALECDVLEHETITEPQATIETIGAPLQEGLPTQVIRGTLRSGRFIEFAGNLLVLGDVNTGAEVRAKGDIVIWGELKGLAHAGFKGSRTAEIRALGMDAVQLRIADIIARRPDRVSAQPAGEWLPSRTAEGAYFPEVARVIEKEIQIFTTKRQK
jgi:septum site-determining protein MinC